MAGALLVLSLEQILRMKTGQLDSALKTRLGNQCFSIVKKIQVLSKISQPIGHDQQAGGNLCGTALLDQIQLQQKSAL